jgi:hypothetical protein
MLPEAPEIAKTACPISPATKYYAKDIVAVTGDFAGS